MSDVEGITVRKSLKKKKKKTTKPSDCLEATSYSPANGAGASVPPQRSSSTNVIVEEGR